MAGPGTHINAVGAIVPARSEFTDDVFPRSAAIAVDSLDTVKELSREFIDYFGSGRASWDRVRPISEVIRAGIVSIDAGQMEAARALGMSYWQAMHRIILPQTFRRVVPPLTNEGIALLKDSSLVSVIGLSELARTGQELASRYAAPLTIWPLVASTGPLTITEPGSLVSSPAASTNTPSGSGMGNGP